MKYGTRINYIALTCLTQDQLFTDNLSTNFDLTSVRFLIPDF